MMDPDTRAQFERGLRHATAQHTGGALDDALRELGWPDALAHDPRAATALLFELQGATNTTSAAIDVVFTAALGLPVEARTGLVLPPVGQSSRPGTIGAAGLEVRGVATAALADSIRTVAIAATETGDVACTVATAALTIRPIEALDPGLGLLDISGTVAPADVEIDPPVNWEHALAAGRRALAHELVGASRTMLALARDHALERVQFGRPIGSFQAIRHRLAETLVAIEAADAVLDAAWLDATPTTAAMAKAMAGRGARTTARHSQQVLAGIGFTTEHDLHRFIRRTLMLDACLANTTTLTKDFGEALVDSRRLPPLLPL